MGPRHVELALEVEKEIAQIASTLARANDSRSRIAWMKFVKEKELYLGVNFPGRSFERGRVLDLEGLHSDVMKYRAFPIPRGADKLRSSRVISTKLANCFRQVFL
jgi:hypothetical protein